MEAEQLALFEQVTVWTTEASYVESGQVFLTLPDARKPISKDPRPPLGLLHHVVGLLVHCGAEVPSEIPDAFMRVYGKFNGQLIVIQVLSNQQYIYPFDFTKPESESA